MSTPSWSAGVAAASSPACSWEAYRKSLWRLHPARSSCRKFAVSHLSARLNPTVARDFAAHTHEGDGAFDPVPLASLIGINERRALRAYWTSAIYGARAGMTPMKELWPEREIEIPPLGLMGSLAVPDDASGIVLSCTAAAQAG